MGLHRYKKLCKLAISFIVPIPKKLWETILTVCLMMSYWTLHMYFVCIETYVFHFYCVVGVTYVMMSPLFPFICRIMQIACNIIRIYIIKTNCTGHYKCQGITFQQNIEDVRCLCWKRVCVRSTVLPIRYPKTPRYQNITPGIYIR